MGLYRDMIGILYPLLCPNNAQLQTLTISLKLWVEYRV